MVVANLLALGRKKYFFNVVNVFLWSGQSSFIIHLTKCWTPYNIQYTIYNVFSFNQMCSSSSAESEVSISLCIFKYRPAVGISSL